jgi:hypothetical protein
MSHIFLELPCHHIILLLLIHDNNDLPDLHEFHNLWNRQSAPNFSYPSIILQGNFYYQFSWYWLEKNHQVRRDVFHASSLKPLILPKNLFVVHCLQHLRARQKHLLNLVCDLKVETLPRFLIVNHSHPLPSHTQGVVQKPDFLKIPTPLPILWSIDHVPGHHTLSSPRLSSGGPRGKSR